MSLTDKQKQLLKKCGVFALMGLIFIGSILWIFDPFSGNSKEQTSGFNADIPDPKKDEIFGDKRDAYEQEQRKNKKNEKMKSLQDMAYMLGDDKKEVELQLEPEDEINSQTNAKGKGKNSIRSSATAYRDINRTLGNFYEKPKDDPQKEALKTKLEELEARLDEKDNKQSAIDDQLALMEKSYQLAARYMPGQYGSQQEYPFDREQEGLSAEEMKNKIVKSTGKKNKVTSVKQATRQTVSALSQHFSQDDMALLYDQPRNYAFHTAEAEKINDNKNTIQACVHEEQTITDGQSLRLRLKEPMLAGNNFIPANSLVTGVAKVQGERLDITVSSVEHDGAIIPVELTVYDTDGQKGVSIPGSMEMNAMKEMAANMGSNLNSTINISQQGAGQQLATDMGRGVIQGASQYLSKKFRAVKVTLKAEHKLLLLPKDNN